MVEACNNCSQNFNILLDPISLNHEKFDTQELDYDTGVKGAHGFVGLKNLGATCYVCNYLYKNRLIPYFNSCSLTNLSGKEY